MGAGLRDGTSQRRCGRLWCPPLPRVSHAGTSGCNCPHSCGLLFDVSAAVHHQGRTCDVGGIGACQERHNRRHFFGRAEPPGNRGPGGQLSSTYMTARSTCTNTRYRPLRACRRRHRFGPCRDGWLFVCPVRVSPFGVYLARIYANRGVSGELLGAARVDGTGELTIFARMGMRLMALTLVTIFVFRFVAVWNNFFLPLVMLTYSHLYPIALERNGWDSQTQHAGAPPLKCGAVPGLNFVVVPALSFAGGWHLFLQVPVVRRCAP
jgi:hypothetical protein